MATTTNYGWETPDDTDLVKDGASAIRTLGSSIDTTTKALNPSTTLGDIEYRSSTANTNTRLAIGTTGQVLTVSGGVPAWETISAGGMTLISTTTLSGASTTITSIPQTYESLYFLINGSTINEYYRLRAQPNSITNGASYVAGYASTFSSYINEEIYLQIENGEISNSANGCAFRIDNYTGTNWKPFTYFGSHINSGGSRVASWGAGAFLNSTNAITSMKFTSAGSFTGGTVKMYGVK